MAAVAFLAVITVLSAPGRSRRRLSLAASISLAAVTLWPMGDLAAHVSLTAALIQRLVVMLVAAPLMVRATPDRIVELVTRPAPLDLSARVLTHPLGALITVTLLGTWTLTPQAIDWGAQSPAGRGVVLAVTLMAGIVMWIPILTTVPGTRHLSLIGRGAYLIVASLVVTSLSVVWIFARHPLYSGLHQQRLVLGISPLLDQQIAGVAAKLLTYFPLWAVAFVFLSRAEAQPKVSEDSPIYVADVDRLRLRERRRATRSRSTPFGDEPHFD
jgi:putative membrane protein